VKKSTYIYIGLTFILGIIIFIWGYNYLKGKDLFRNETVYYVRAHEVSGLVNANPVLFHGMQVGAVRNIHLAPDGSGDIMVELVLNKKIPLPKDTRSRIINATLLGDKSVDLKLGTSKKMAKSGDTLVGCVEVTLKQQVTSALAPMKARAEAILSNVDSLVASISKMISKDNANSIDTTVKNIQGTFANLNKTTANLNALVRDNRIRISQTLANIDSLSMVLGNKKGDIGKMISNLKSVSDTLQQAQIGQTLRETKQSLAHLNALLAKINAGQGTVGALMTNDSLYLQLNKTTLQLNKLLKDIRENPHRYLKFSVF